MNKTRKIQEEPADIMYNIVGLIFIHHTIVAMFVKVICKTKENVYLINLNCISYTRKEKWHVDLKNLP